MEQMYADIFDVQYGSVHDGPGIRTTFFLKGCNLHCAWCHNPESIQRREQLQYFEQKCIRCRLCETVCTRHAVWFNPEGKRNWCEERCTLCGRCVEQCQQNAIGICGSKYSVDHVVELAQRDQLFYRQTGGVTFSGGEPLLQVDFLKEVLPKLKNCGIHTAVDTAGNVGWKYFEQLCPWTDLFLYDIKCMDTNKHQAFTGAGNEQILKNLEHLNSFGAHIWIRVPLIPGFNDSRDNFQKMAEFLQPLQCVEKIELLPFYKLGKPKYDSLGWNYKFAQAVGVEKERMESFCTILQNAGLPARIRF